ncbi:Cation channel sperm-associated protein 3 [Gonapodya sp. JEL0774]|nr:Cation channel sperm-associated protein 3 [Gonapodya sp. JEL0774]
MDANNGLFKTKKPAQWNQQRAALKATELFKEFETQGGAGKTDAALFRSETHRIDDGKKKEHRPLTKKYVIRIVEDRKFNWCIMAVILCNIITITIETEYAASAPSTDGGVAETPAVFQYLDLVYLAIYTIEAGLKIYADFGVYWKGGYNRFDFFILIMSYAQWFASLVATGSTNLTVLRMLRALRALRAFRSVSMVRTLQVIVNALTRTITRDIIDVIILLLITIFIYAVMGVYLFGNDPSNIAYADWSGLDKAFHVLWVWTTTDGWQNYQQRLEDSGYTGNQYFAISFIFIASMIITNLFIAIICQNIDEATQADRALQLYKLRKARQQKRDMFMRKQKSDMRNLVAQQKLSGNMHELLAKLAGTLSHEDIVAQSHLSCNVTWLETYMVTLHYHENTMYRIQQTHFRIANTLAEIVDSRYSARLKEEI